MRQKKKGFSLSFFVFAFNIAIINVVKMLNYKGAIYVRKNS